MHLNCLQHSQANLNAAHPTAAVKCACGAKECHTRVPLVFHCEQWPTFNPLGKLLMSGESLGIVVILITANYKAHCIYSIFTLNFQT